MKPAKATDTPKTGRIVEQTPPGLSTVEDSDGFTHTSSKVSGAQLLTDLNLTPEEDAEPPEPAVVVETKPAVETAKPAAPAPPIVDPLDAVTDEELSTRADLERTDAKYLPRKKVIAQLVKRADKRRAGEEAAKAQAETLRLENETLKKAKPAEAGKEAAVDDDPNKPFERKKFDKPRPVYKDPEDPYDPVAVSAARQAQEDALAVYYDERDDHNRAQDRQERDHEQRRVNDEMSRVAAAQRATQVIYDRGKARHADYDQTLQGFIGRGGRWSPDINVSLMKIAKADVDLAADVTRALVDEAYAADLAVILKAPPEDVHDKLLLFTATRLTRPAAEKSPAKPAAAEKVPAGPAGGADVSQSREPFHPGGASPESPVHGREPSLTSIPTSKFDVFMTTRDAEDGRNGLGARR